MKNAYILTGDFYKRHRYMAGQDRLTYVPIYYYNLPLALKKALLAFQNEKDLIINIACISENEIDAFRKGLYGFFTIVLLNFEQDEP